MEADHIGDAARIQVCLEHDQVRWIKSFGGASHVRQFRLYVGIVALGAAVEQFVLDAPHDQGRVVAVAPDHAGDVVLYVPPEHRIGVSVSAIAPQGALFNDHHPHFVGVLQPFPLPRLRVKPERNAVGLAHGHERLPDLGVGLVPDHGPAAARQQVALDAVEVEVRTLGPKLTESKSLRDFVCKRVGLRTPQPDTEVVKVRVLGRPEAGVGERGAQAPATIGSDRDRGQAQRNRISVQYLGIDLGTVVGLASNRAAHGQRPPANGWSDGDVVQERLARSAEQLGVVPQPVGSPVSADGRHELAHDPRIVAQVLHRPGLRQFESVCEHRSPVLATHDDDGLSVRPHMVRDLHFIRCPAVELGPNERVIYIDTGSVTRAHKPQEQPASVPFLRDGHLAAIPGVAGAAHSVAGFQAGDRHRPPVTVD